MKRIHIAFALLGLCALVYGGVLAYPFVALDDNEYVTGNPHVAGGLTAANVAWSLTGAHSSNWHPLTWISHMLDVQLFGMHAGGHHATSLLLHALNTVLLFLLLHRMTGDKWPSAFVAALFALHPAHVESVAWVSERKDVLSTLFWILTTWAYVDWTRDRRAWRQALVIALFALGLMSKPMLVTLPFTLLLLDVWPLARTEPLWPRVREKLPLFALAAASSVITLIVQRAAGSVESIAIAPLGDRLSNAAIVYVLYLVKLAAPVGLAAFYPYPESVSYVAAALAAVVLAAITLLAVRFARSFPEGVVGWLWYLGTLVPVIGIVQVGSQRMADRYTYVSAIGIFILVAFGAARLAGTRRWLPWAAGAVCLVLAGLAHAQVETWRDSETLFRHAIAVTGGGALVHNNYGFVLMEEGKLDEAAQQFEAALAKQPGMATARLNLAKVREKQGRTGDAEQVLREVQARAPASATVANELGTTLAASGRLDEAIVEFRKAVGAAPRMREAQRNLALALLSAKRPAEADAALRAAVAAIPDDAELWYLSGVGRADRGDAPGAATAFERALALDPRHARAHNRLGVLLAEAGRMPDATAHFRRAVELDPAYDEARRNLEQATRLGVR